MKVENGERNSNHHNKLKGGQTRETEVKGSKWDDGIDRGRERERERERKEQQSASLGRRRPAQTG